MKIKPTVPATFGPAYHLGVGFFLIFAACMPTQNLLTSLNGKLGYYSIAVLYFCMSFSGPIATFAINYLGGTKAGLVTGGLSYVVFQIANILVGIPEVPDAANYFILLSASAVLGLGACVLWTSEGVYASQVATLADQHGVSTVKNSLGYVNGVVLVFLQSANWVMNLASSAILTSGVSPVILFIILAAACGGGWIVVLFLPSLPDPAQIIQISTGFESIPDAEIIGDAKEEGKKESVQQSDRVKSSETSVSAWDSIMDLINIHKHEKMISLLALFFACGLNQGYLYSTFTGAVITPALGENWVGYVMAASAAVDALGSYMFGFLSDRIGRHPILFAGAFINIVACLIVILLGTSSMDAYVTVFLIAILLGIADASWMTITSALVAESFPKEDVTNAFAAFTMWRSFSTAVISLLGPFIPLSIRTGILAAFVVIAGISQVIVLRRSSRIMS
eukprot:CAMPEP_0167746478 /NCGR_PEP_ID=MMETSP0110_2-20121227/3734_1 /TAXON_ID=629695 /ORGANISM="Gymnochlora sp., Strain CCMP2014" /LENGTH=450 /DNA_ID=CAMNT_0007631245 /DNA_START=18 /DNA_END=1370 /DNA_ORIENTATION=-